MVFSGTMGVLRFSLERLPGCVGRLHTAPEIQSAVLEWSQTGHLRSADTGIGQIAEDAANTGRMPHLSRSGTIAVVIQESGCPLGAETFFDIFVENDFDKQRLPPHLLSAY